MLKRSILDSFPGICTRFLSQTLKSNHPMDERKVAENQQTTSSTEDSTVNGFSRQDFVYVRLSCGIPFVLSFPSSFF